MHNVDDCRAIVAGSLPLLDVRAPVEYARGALPGAVNLPLLYDQEREAVGKAYKSGGRDAAVALGHRLVSGDIKHSRLAAWQRFVAEHPTALICCWRGGMRSQIVQQWLADAGVAAPRVSGGFKALRRFCMDVSRTQRTARPDPRRRTHWQRQDGPAPQPWRAHRLGGLGQPPRLGLRRLSDAAANASDLRERAGGGTPEDGCNGAARARRRRPLHRTAGRARALVRRDAVRAARHRGSGHGRAHRQHLSGIRAGSRRCAGAPAGGAGEDRTPA